MSNSSLVTYTKLSPYKNSPRNHAIDTITIHCMAGQLSIETCGNVFQSSKSSSNYGVGQDGRIGLYVDEKDRSWASSNGVNDNRAVTIEVASNSYHPYAVSDKAYEATIKLVADICKRNGIKKLIWSTDKNARINHTGGVNMTVHRDFANKACPGDYLYNKMGDIANRVNALLGASEPAKTTTSATTTAKSSNEEFIEKVAKFVQKYAPQYGVKVVSPIVAQFCLESSYGTSELAKNAHNYVGIKYNKSISEKDAYIKVGSEQKADGTYVSSSMKWCNFSSLEKCVEGYFKFLFKRSGVTRYNNLVGITNPKKYLETIKADGYATSLKYVDNNWAVVEKWNLTKYDPTVTAGTVKPATTTAQKPATTVSTATKTEDKNKLAVAKSKDAKLAGKYIVKAASGLRMRLAPGDGTIIATVPYGQAVQNYGYYTTVNGVKWLLCSCKGVNGYMSIQYLKK